MTWRDIKSNMFSICIMNRYLLFFCEIDTQEEYYERADKNYRRSKNCAERAGQRYLRVWTAQTGNVITSGFYRLETLGHYKLTLRIFLSKKNSTLFAKGALHVVKKKIRNCHVICKLYSPLSKFGNFKKKTFIK